MASRRQRQREIITDQEYLTIPQKTLSDLLDDETIERAMDTVREDVPSWDSFNHIDFIVAVEAQYGDQVSDRNVEPFPMWERSLLRLVYGTPLIASLCAGIEDGCTGGQAEDRPLKTILRISRRTYCAV